MQVDQHSLVAVQRPLLDGLYFSPEGAGRRYKSSEITSDVNWY